MRRFFHLALLAAVAVIGIASLTETVPADPGACTGGLLTARAMVWATVPSCDDLVIPCRLRVRGAAETTCERKLTSNGDSCDLQEIIIGNCTLLANGEYQLECSMKHRCESACF